jgi:hypothetical protein
MTAPAAPRFLLDGCLPRRKHGSVRMRALVPAVMLLAACGGSDGDSCTAPSAPAAVDCSSTGVCPALAIAGDAPATTPGSFKGFADPNLMADPAVAGRVWLSYSWPYVANGTDTNGDPVLLAAVNNRLARSDDGGVTFTYQQVLWPDVAAADPEGSGETGRISSETASLASITNAGVTTWYGTHLRYFLRPITGYNPKYATSWHVRIGAASTPAGLATAQAAQDEAVLGVTNTHAAYGVDVRLDQLAGLPVQQCAMLNNPTLFTQDLTLYLVVECLAFVGQTPDYTNTSTQVFATSPFGAPNGWVWRHAGELADDAIATELGNDTIRQPDVSRAADGTLIALLTPAHIDANSPTGTTGDGCVALELESLEPPRFARDCTGNLVVREQVAGVGVGACTHDRLSATGIIGHAEGATGGNWRIPVSDLHP